MKNLQEVGVIERELCFNDLIGCAISVYEKSDTFISLIKLIRSEIE